MHPLRLALLLQEVPGCAHGDALSQVPGVKLAAWLLQLPYACTLAGAPCESNNVLALREVLEVLSSEEGWPTSIRMLIDLSWCQQAKCVLLAPYRLAAAPTTALRIAWARLELDGAIQIFTGAFQADCDGLVMVARLAFLTCAATACWVQVLD